MHIKTFIKNVIRISVLNLIPIFFKTPSILVCNRLIWYTIQKTFAFTRYVKMWGQATEKIAVLIFFFSTSLERQRAESIVNVWYAIFEIEMMVKTCCAGQAIRTHNQEGRKETDQSKELNVMLTTMPYGIYGLVECQGRGHLSHVADDIWNIYIYFFCFQSYWRI